MLKVRRREKRKRRKEKKKKKKVHKERKKQRSEGRGKKVKDKRWMEATRTGATERSSLTKKNNGISSGGERRWRQKAETCPQVTLLHTHTYTHTCMWPCIHKTTRCTCVCMHDTHIHV